MPRTRQRAALFIAAALATSGVATALLRSGGDGGYSPRTNPTFVNWETPQVHPIDMTPSGSRLLVTNTADNRLEVFTMAPGMPSLAAEVPVGLDPVTVRPRTENEVWVVNHISDSISIVDLTTLNVVKTLKTKDEPNDVVFAGSPQRAFVTCGGAANTVQVFDPANPGAAPTNIAIDANDPRSLAVSPDGSTVYAAIFQSGNGSTVLGGGGAAMGTRLAFPPNAVSDTHGPYGGTNPPPNSGAAFSPPIASGNLPTNAVGLIVKKDASGHWMDDNSHDWTSMVTGANSTLSGRPAGWDLPDHDLAVINASTLSLTYATGLMNICMSVGVNPATGQVTVVGTDATNEVRFEPNVKGRFTRVNMATVSPATLGKTIVDLNPHLLPYAVQQLPQSERDKSIGDPRAIAWLSNGSKAYVAGMGSNNVIAIDAAGARADGPGTTINVGEGPTGLCLDEARGRLYVLNKFGASVSVVSLNSDTEINRVSFFDPSPTAIKVGRKHLYDTHKNSGLGQLACGSCHVDARTDRLAWDLGDPQGTIALLTAQDLNEGFNFPGLEPNTTPTPFQNFHPMKGPMTTQTLQDIIGHEPFHWRADRRGLENFGPAFESLNGDDTTLTTQEMQEFEDFLATIYVPPNPNRNFDNTLPTSLPLPGHYTTGRFAAAGTQLPNGNAQNGLAIYRSPTLRFDGGAFACVTCHTLPTGGGPDVRLVNFNSNTFQAIPVGPQGQHHVAVVSVDGSTNVTIKIPQLRTEYLKTGFDCSHTSNSAGFGVLHDGSVDSLERFVSEPVFNVRSDQDVADLVAFVLSFAGSDFPAPSPATAFEPPGPPSQDTEAAVGVQTTLVSAANPDPGQLTLIASMISLANTNKVGLVVKGRQGGVQRGYAYIGASTFQSDHAGQTITAAALQAAAAPGSELTYTVVPKGTETRIGIDRDLNGVLDFDEPPPPPPCGSADFNNDGDVGTDADIEAFFACLGGNCCETCGTADFNADGDVGTDADIEAFFRVLAGGSC